MVAFDGVTMGEDEKREGKPLSAFSKEVLLSWSMFWYGVCSWNSILHVAATAVLSVCVLTTPVVFL